jgi:hypothetical protein
MGPKVGPKPVFKNAVHQADISFFPYFREKFNINGLLIT